MADKKVSVRKAQISAAAADKKLRKGFQKDGLSPVPTLDSFVNFQQKMGIGADNALSTANYGFNPITRIRTLLEWIYRGSWIGGMVVDIISKDMTRAGVELKGEVDPQSMEKIHEYATGLKIWNAIAETIQWAKLYGGAIGVLLIDGQDLSTPFRVESVGAGQFKGIAVLDRWMCNPQLNDLVTELGPDMGTPKFYDINLDAPLLRGQKVHHSRCLRMLGIKLPYYQALMENLWGESILERLYDRMVGFDSASTGAAQLVYKSYLRTVKVKGLREVISAGGPALTGLVKYFEMMRRFQSIEGLTALDGEDDFVAHTHSAFTGLSDALMQFGQQLAGASGIPLVRLFGQSPAGLNATGESDIRMYYDNIKQQQESDLLVPVTTIYRAIARSAGVALPEGFQLKFRPLWQLSEKEKAEIAETTGRAVGAAVESALVSQAIGLRELRQSSEITGIFSNITDEEINKADSELPPSGAEAMELEAKAAKELAEAGAEGTEESKSASKTQDSSPAVNNANKALIARAETLIAAGELRAAYEALRGYEYDNRTQDYQVAVLRKRIRSALGQRGETLSD